MIGAEKRGDKYVVKTRNHVYYGTKVSETETEFVIRTAWGTQIPFPKVEQVTITKIS